MPLLTSEADAMLARARIDKLAQAVGERFDFLLDNTEEIEQGWVFFCNTAEFVRMRNPLSALAGNGPILVTREGVIHQLKPLLNHRAQS